MYTIKQAAARSGVSVATLRAWERRYGVVSPKRTPAGYRLYDDTAMTRLIAMRHLVADEGWQPSQAAGRVLEPGVDLAALVGALPPVDHEVMPPAQFERAESKASIVKAFVTAAKGLDLAAMEQLLDDSFAAQRFETAVEGLVSPAMHAIGEAWVNGVIDVGAEHAASETVRRRLAGFFRSAGVGEGLPEVVIGLPPDGDHDLGAFAVAVAARRAGIRVLYLGANVPQASWLRTTRETGAPLAVIGVVTPPDVDAAVRVIASLRGTDRPPICLVGGPLAADPAIPSDVDRLSGRLDEAVAVMERLLRPGKGRSRGLSSPRTR